MRWNLKEAASKSLVRRTEITYKARLREISWLRTTKSNKEVESALGLLTEAGFVSIEIREMAIPKLSLLAKEDTVAKTIIGTSDKFQGDDWFYPDEKVVIYKYVSIK